MREINGYRIVNIDLGLGGVSHSFFLKEHSKKSAGSDSDGKDGKTLFVGNVDYGRMQSADRIEALLRDLFSTFGDVEAVSLSQFKNDSERSSSTKSRFAHVAFAKRKSVRSALTASDDIFSEIGKQVASSWGMSEEIMPQKAKRIYDRCRLGDTDVDAMMLRVDADMQEFEEREQTALAALEHQYGQVDEDGFQLVKPRKKRKRTEDLPRRSSGTQRLRKKKSGSGASSELKNFYSFQQREAAQKKVLELRRRFEEDKQKVAAMKAARKFKPV